jgi:nicotinamide-nucleotide adenylyltransferase
VEVKTGKVVKMASRGLMIGRFQPFHNGHLALAKQILAECDELIIAIGSAQFNFIEKDPFTAGERITMIYRSLKEAGIATRRCYMIPLANYENNATWLNYLKMMLPQFSVVYSGNDFVKLLVEKQDPKIEVRKPKFMKKAHYNGTHIRSLMSNGKAWKRLVPPSTANFIDEIDGVKRVKLLAHVDSLPQSW